jgi:hypothetical protein
MIGFLARTINGARNHPVKALVSRFVELANASMCEGWFQDDEDRPPLVPATAVHSLTDRYQVIYPLVTKATSKFDAAIPDHRRRVLERMLGKAFCDAHPQRIGGRDGISIRRTNSKVQIGSREFSCRGKEDGRSVYQSRASNFCALKEHIPNYDDEPDADGPRVRSTMLYGRLQQFLHIRIPAWGVDEYYGKCTLFEGVHDATINAFMVDLDPAKQCRWRDAAGVERLIEYVKLSNIEGMIALAPMYSNLITSAQRRADPKLKQPPPVLSTVWCALLLEK